MNKRIKEKEILGEGTGKEISKIKYKKSKRKKDRIGLGHRRRILSNNEQEVRSARLGVFTY